MRPNEFYSSTDLGAGAPRSNQLSYAPEATQIIAEINPFGKQE